MTVTHTIHKGITPLARGAAQFVPDTLAERLFGDMDGRRLGTFVLLDAAVITNLFEMIDLSGLPYCCLFNDDAADDMRDAAPYLVELEPDHMFTRQLFTHDPDTPWHLWDRGPGVFIRADTGLAALRAHFRKFTFLRDSQTEKWNVFRFHAPEIFRTMIAASPEARNIVMGPGVVTMGCPGLDDTWVALHRDGDSDLPVSRTLDARHFYEKPIAAPYIAERREKRVLEAMAFLRRETPGKVAILSDADLRRVVETAFARCDDTGVKDPAARLKYLLLVAGWGSHFESDPLRVPDLTTANWMDAEGYLTGFRDTAPLLLLMDRWSALGAQDMERPKRLVTAMQRVYADADFATDQGALAQTVSRLWPARARALGLDALKAGIKTGIEVAQGLGLQGVDVRGYVCLSLYFGAYFAYDPLYPWAMAALADDGRRPEDRRLALGVGVMDYWNGLLGQVSHANM